MSFRRILPCAWLGIALLAGALRADEATDRAQDAVQMKRVWAALLAYQKENGELPDRLGSLVPKHLANPKDLISPRHNGEEANGADDHEEYPSSYIYEWGLRKFRDVTLAEIKTCQLEEFGPVVPLLSCTSYEKSLHISHAGDLYEATGNWETSPAVREIIARRGLGPGASTGKFLELFAVDPTGAPASGVNVIVRNRFVGFSRLPQRQLTTGNDGRARVPFGPVESMNGLLNFEQPGHFAFSEEAGKDGFPDALRVIVSPCKRVSGVVTDPKGTPLANTTVYFAREPDKKDLTGEWSERLRVHMLGFHHAGKAVTDKDGKWEIAAFPDQPGLKVKCTVSHPDFAVKVLVLDHAALQRDGYFSGEAKLMLAEPFRVSGKVINPDGSPTAEAVIFWCSMSDPASGVSLPKSIETKSNAAGEFELRARVPEGTKIVVLPKSGAAPLLHGLQASPDMSPLTLQLGVGRILKGKVVNRHTRPFADLPILFSGWMKSHVPLSVHPIVAVTDADGNWTWEGAPAENVKGRIALPSGAFVSWGEQRRNQVGLVQVTEE